MAEKFIGAQIRAGQFTDKDTGKVIDYNNLVLSTVTRADCGEVANDPIKIANTAQNITAVFGQPITMKWLRARLGWYLDVFYNKYRKPERIIFYEKDPTQTPEGYTGVATEGITDYTPAPVKSSGGITADDDYPEELKTTGETKDKAVKK